MRGLAILAILLSSVCAHAAQFAGTVRAADQLIPGATVTARAGESKIVTYTDENGRYTLDLKPGAWEVDIAMFGFDPQHAQVTIANEPVSRDWIIEMPRGPAGQASSSAGDVQPVPGRRNRPQFARGGGGRGSMGRGGRGPQQPGQQSQQQQPAFQNMSVTATEAGEQALASTAIEPPPDTNTADTEDALSIRGSMSGGLGAAADEQERRERMMAGGRGPGGPGGPDNMAANFGPMSLGPADNIDPLGMNAFGAAGANSGFGADNNGGFGRGGGRGGGGRGGGAGAGGGGGGGRGGRGGGGLGANGNARRGPFNGQFATFGNRRRNSRPPYQGQVFADVNNSALNAAPFSLNGQPALKPSSSQIRYGFNFGGPLRIPKLITNDRISFSVNYSGNRGRSAVNYVSTVPTLLQRDGDFSQTLVRSAPITIYDPTTHLPFPGNIIPTDRIDHAAAGLLQFFPSPQFASIIQNYQLVTSRPSSNDNLGVRLNAPVSRKDRLNFNEQYSRNHSESPQIFGYRDTSSGYGLSASAGWSHSFKPRFNSSLNFAFSRSISKLAPFFAYSSNVAAALGITGTSEDPITYGPPNLSFTNFGALSDGSASVNRNQTANLTETITYVARRRHNLTFGAGYRRMQQNVLAYAGARGAFSFSGLLTSGFDANVLPLANTGYDFADFLLGLPQSSSLRLGNFDNYFRGWAINGYGQDDWRWKTNFTLNIGLRYEYFSPYTELRGRMANLDLSPARNAVAAVTPDTAGPYSGAYPAGLINPDKNNFSPRLGYSWRPSTKHSRIFRGGYSIFFSGANYAGFASRLAAQPPFATSASLTTSPDDPLTIEHGFPGAPPQTITNNFAIDKDYKPAYAQTWTVAIQQTLPHNLLVELEYVGTKGTGLDITIQPDRASPGSPLTAQQRLPIANATGFSYELSQGNSIFHAGQIRITRRFARGMSANALYTFSKSLDNASSFGGGGGVIAQYPDNLALERGLSTFDQRHKLQVQYMLSSPVGIHGLWRNGGWKTKTLTGWTLSGNLSAQSGTPLTARVQGNLSNTGGTAAFGTGRAQATGAGIEDGAYPYFNLLAFTLPQSGQYGDAARNTIPGLFRFSLNAALQRAWRIGDTRRQFQVRLSATNAMNHVSITNIGTTVNAANYGLPTAASGNRTVQLTMRVNF
jgi:hypothetical protein